MFIQSAFFHTGAPPVDALKSPKEVIRSLRTAELGVERCLVAIWTVGGPMMRGAAAGCPVLLPLILRISETDHGYRTYMGAVSGEHGRFRAVWTAKE